MRSWMAFLASMNGRSKYAMWSSSPWWWVTLPCMCWPDVSRMYARSPSISVSMYWKVAGSCMSHSPPTATYTGDVCANTPRCHTSWCNIPS